MDFIVALLPYAIVMWAIVLMIFPLLGLIGRAKLPPEAFDEDTSSEPVERPAWFAIGCALAVSAWSHVLALASGAAAIILAFDHLIGAAAFLVVCAVPAVAWAILPTLGDRFLPDAVSDAP